MILIDTSAWVEFLRDTGSPTCEAVDALLDDDIGVCDAITMEVLAGACDERHLADLRGLLARASIVRIVPADYEAAAALYRACRRQGVTVRKLIDCLIAAVALRSGAALLHADVDFTLLAQVHPVRIHPDSAH